MWREQIQEIKNFLKKKGIKVKSFHGTSDELCDRCCALNPDQSDYIITTSHHVKGLPLFVCHGEFKILLYNFVDYLYLPIGEGFKMIHVEKFIKNCTKCALCDDEFGKNSSVTCSSCGEFVCVKCWLNICKTGIEKCPFCRGNYDVQGYSEVTDNVHTIVKFI